MADGLPYGLDRFRLTYNEDETSLFAQYRPWNVDEFYGPSGKVIRLFARQLYNDYKDKTNRMMHFYLFHGPPGSGKTSVAITLSKMINCEQPVRENGMQFACNKCPSCRSIEGRALKGKHGAVQYVDANAIGKDGILNRLQDSLRGSSLDGRNTILILEEAQELTPKSLSSLLAPAENLRKNHYIILVSSEPEKILKNDAINSRVNRVRINSWSTDEIMDVLKDIAGQEYLAGRTPLVPESILQRIADNCGDNPREAVKLLQTEVIGGGARNDDGTFDLPKLEKEVMSGAPGRKLITDFSKAILNGKISDGMDILQDRVVGPRIDLNPFVYRVIQDMRVNFDRVRKQKRMNPQVLLHIMRGIVTFGDRFYAHRIVDPRSAITIATMEALEHTSKGMALLKESK